LKSVAAYRIVAGGEDEMLKKESDGFVSLAVVERKSGDGDPQHWVEAVAS